MVGKKVNLFAITLLNIFIVSSVTSSAAAPTNSESNIGFPLANERIASGEMAIPVPVIYEQDSPQQESLRAEDE